MYLFLQIIFVLTSATVVLGKKQVQQEKKSLRTKLRLYRQTPDDYKPIELSPFFAPSDHGPVNLNPRFPIDLGTNGHLISSERFSDELIPHGNLLSPGGYGGGLGVHGQFQSAGGVLSDFGSSGLSLPSTGGSIHGQTGLRAGKFVHHNGILYDRCPNGLATRADGQCVQPRVSRNIYLFNAPSPQVIVRPAKELPSPKIHYNYVFLNTPDAVNVANPIIVPPPQQKTLVYLLSKNQESAEQQVIEVPSVPSEPEVFFVNYNEGENPQLPGGIDLQTALSQSNSHPGQHISSGGFAHGGGAYGSGFNGFVGDVSHDIGNFVDVSSSGAFSSSHSSLGPNNFAAVTNSLDAYNVPTDLSTGLSNNFVSTAGESTFGVKHSPKGFSESVSQVINSPAGSYR